MGMETAVFVSWNGRHDALANDGRLWKTALFPGTWGKRAVRLYAGQPLTISPALVRAILVMTGPVSS